jgi:hypothetical protein
MNTESNKNVKLNREELKQIKGEIQPINQNKLAKCNEQITALENAVDNKRKAIENTNLSDKEKSNIQQKLDEEVALLDKLYDQREELKNQIENQINNKEKENKKL